MKKQNTLAQGVLNSSVVTFEEFANFYAELSAYSQARFLWNGFPETINPVSLERFLYEYGLVAIFYDDVVGWQCLPCTYTAPFNNDGYPTRFRAFSPYNAYRIGLELSDNAFIIFNNLARLPGVELARLYAARMASASRIIDLNINDQKNPIIVQGTHNQMLTLEQMQAQFDNYQKYIKIDSDIVDLSNKPFTKLDIQAPFVSPQIQTQLLEIKNEYLCMLGVSNVGVIKKERQITDEIQVNMNNAYLARYNYLKPRNEFCEKFNNVTGLNVTVKFFDEEKEVIKNESLHDAN